MKTKINLKRIPHFSFQQNNLPKINCPISAVFPGAKLFRHMIGICYRSSSSSKNSVLLPTLSSTTTTTGGSVSYDAKRNLVRYDTIRYPNSATRKITFQLYN